tara:strand:- start:1400 stop:1531 length:132 start_codon:yes stop_codon:yes gene_type:complete
MSLDLVDIDMAMDLIKEDIIKELSESLGKQSNDDLNENISYDS